MAFTQAGHQRAHASVTARFFSCEGIRPSGIATVQTLPACYVGKLLFRCDGASPTHFHSSPSWCTASHTARLPKVHSQQILFLNSWEPLEAEIN